MLLGTSGTSLFKNCLTGKATTRVGEDSIRIGEGTVRAGQYF